MKKYLGDSVYIETDPRGGFILTTENGLGASNTIVLETEVIDRLIEVLAEWHTVPAEPSRRKEVSLCVSRGMERPTEPMDPK